MASAWWAAHWRLAPAEALYTHKNGLGALVTFCARIVKQRASPKPLHDDNLTGQRD
jgi:hypothetical protein